MFRQHQRERAHNDHLQILAELGLVGFVAWISIFVTAFYVAWNCLRAKQEWIPAQAFFVCLGIVSFLVVGSLLVATGYFSPIPQKSDEAIQETDHA